MQILIGALVGGIVPVWAIGALFIAALAAKSMLLGAGNPTSIQPNSHTLRDIGIEPGSLTWI